MDATALAAWLERLDRQAEATRAMRQPLYARAGLQHARTILDVGCGSGAVTSDVARFAPQARVVALDNDAQMTRRTQAELGDMVSVAHGRAQQLPFADASFDVALCNLLLLWCDDAANIVREMARVVRPGGAVLASMEPDYGGKIHFPENPLIDLVFRGEGVARRGGDPHAGRKLRAWFVGAGLRTDVGLGTTEIFTTDQDLVSFRRGRDFYRRLLAESGRSAREIDAWEQEYLESLSDGTQLSFLPVFWAIGRKPVPGDVDTT